MANHTGFAPQGTGSTINKNQTGRGSGPVAPKPFFSRNPFQFAVTPSAQQDQKVKGEVNEMRDALSKAINSRNDEERTDVLRKIIQNMTLGMDVSDLFQLITMASHTKDLVQKKMIYLYLNNYASGDEVLAMMAVNSIVKDTSDDSPRIRGLALRWLCALGTPSLVEYMVEPLKAGLTDVTPYVRRCATLSCAKVFQLSHQPFIDGVIINRLYQLIRDKDPHVVINALRSLNEILVNSGGVVINPKIVLHLMTHLKEFNEWGQIFVLKLLEKYQPQDDEELFALMNLLDSRFQHPNSGLVLATVHLFLTYTQNKPEIHHHVFLRLHAPIMSLLLRTPSEIQYSTLSHILLLAKRQPSLFTADYKYFYLGNSDPDYVKLLKLAILQEVANPVNARELLTELSFYVTDSDISVAKESIHVISRLAIRIPPASEAALELLLGFLELEQFGYVLETTLLVMKDMLRRFPGQAADVIPRLAQTLEIIKDTEAVASAISMIGNYGDNLEDAPYILEEIIQDWSSETHSKVKNQLILATLKLFFKRPNEVKLILGQLFEKAVDDFTNPDVHDKAIFYFRLINTNVEMCKNVVLSKVDVVAQNDEDAGEIDRLFEQFNTLSVIFKQTVERFTKERVINLEFEEAMRAEQARLEQEDEIRRIEEAKPQFGLDPNASIEPQTFEANWLALTPSGSVQVKCSPLNPSLENIERLFADRNIKTIAKGGASEIKFFLYAAHGLNLILVDLTINCLQGVAQAIFKTDGVPIPAFQQIFEDVLSKL